jgi:preprotein translocase subunit SecG
METVIIVIHMMVIVALVAVVLMQRSEGGALGIGGASNFLSTRSQGNVLTRSTAILAAIFFATSIALTLLGRFAEKPTSIIEQAPPAPAAPANPATPPAAPAAPATPAAPAAPANDQGTLLNQLQGISKPATGGEAAPAAPAAPATPAPAQ